MANDQKQPRATDEQLIATIRSGELADGVSLADLADELLHLRRAMRGDSRQAHQLRRLRWTVENQVMKTEALLEQVEKLGADRSEPPTPSQPEDDDDRG